MRRLNGSLWGVTALLAGAAASGACGGQAIGEEGGGAGAETGGPGGMAGLGGRGGRGGGGGRGGQGGTAMAGASGRGGSAAGGQGAGGSVSTGGNAGVAGASMGGASGIGGEGTCAAPFMLGPETNLYSGHVERSSVNGFDVCLGNGPEEVLRWTPPKSGRYVIDTFGSRFDTVLYVSANLGCPPTAPDAEQDCNDDFNEDFDTLQSLLDVQAVAGQDMLIVVDSYISAGGDFTLNIRGEAECPIMNLGEQLGDSVYSTFELAGDARLLPPTDGCRGGELGVSFAWQAPSSGIYRFNTSGSAFPVVLALRQSCEGELLGCYSEGDVNNGSETTASLEQGDQIVIEVTPVELEPQVSFGHLVLNIHRL